MTPSAGVLAWDAELDPAANARTVLDAVLAQVPAPDGVPVTTSVVEGGAAQALDPGLAGRRPADRRVAGARRFAGMLLGSVSQHVVAHARCPVTVVR